MGMNVRHGLSGASRLFLSLVAYAACLQPAHAVAPILDLDFDGVPDSVRRELRYDDQQPVISRLVVRSGSTGADLRSLVAPEPNDLFGWSVTTIDDLDGDGIAELAIGAPQAMDAGAGTTGMGRVYVISPATNERLLTIGDEHAGVLGLFVCRLDDRDGDGLPELLISGADRHESPAKVPAGFSIEARWWIASSASGFVLESGSGSIDSLRGLVLDDDDTTIDPWSDRQTPGERTALMGLAGDLDADGDVDHQDLTCLLAAWAAIELPIDRATNGPPMLVGDLDLDRTIDWSDLVLLLSQFGLNEASPDESDGDGGERGDLKNDPCVRRGCRICNFTGHCPGGLGGEGGGGGGNGDDQTITVHGGTDGGGGTGTGGGGDTSGGCGSCPNWTIIPTVIGCPGCCQGPPCSCQPCSPSCDSDNDGTPNTADCDSPCVEGNAATLCECRVIIDQCPNSESPEEMKVLIVLPDEGGAGSALLSASGTPPDGAYEWFTRGLTSPSGSGSTITVSASEPMAASANVSYTITIDNEPCTSRAVCGKFLVWRCVLRETPPSRACPQETISLGVDASNIPGGSLQWFLLEAGSQNVIQSGTGLSFTFTVAEFGDLIVRARFLNGDEIVREKNYPISVQPNGCIKRGEQGPVPCEAVQEGEQQDPDYGDPVLFFSGEFIHEQEDLFIPGRGMDFRLVRTYRSKTGRNDADPLAEPAPFGNNWDHSYNIRVVRPSGVNDELIFMDGSGRRDTFSLNGGEYTRPEYFTPIRIDSDRVRYSTGDGTTYVFFLPDNTPDPARGKIESITDRNGNTMTFGYDSLGRLRQVFDSLERLIEFGYAVGDHKIRTITDFAGRTIQYTYYGGGNTEGNPGDLRYATLPGFASTPEFPLESVHEAFPFGRTWGYTYYTGSAPYGNNLRDVIDPRGEVVTRNSYSSETDPMGFMYDRVIRQERDGLEHRFSYEPVVGEPGLIGRACRAWVVGRAGRVCEFVYDDLFRLRRKTEYTGLYDGTSWGSGAPPRGPRLRTQDPDSFTWIFDFNGDSRITREVLPNGDTTISVYDAANADPRKRGNRLRRYRVPAGASLSCSNGSCIEERWEYEFSFSGSASSCCGGWGFPTAYIDPNGRRTEFEYDPDSGDLIEIRHPIVSGASTIDSVEQAAIETRAFNGFGQIVMQTLPGPPAEARIDVFDYFDGSEATEYADMRGYLKSRTTAAGTLDLTTWYEYDIAGNLRAVIDPSGQRAETLFNQANLPARELSRPTAIGGSVRNRRDLFYDAALNVARIDVENRDAAGLLDSNAAYSTHFEFDALSRLTRVTREVDSSNSTIEEMEYDGNDEVVLIRKGASFAGQPQNTVTRHFDERGLLLLETLGGTSAEASTARYDYDLNGNLSGVTRGHGTPDASTSTFTYDHFDRLITSTDAMGNTSRREYDRASNLTRTLVEGQMIDQPSGAGPANVRLGESVHAYDERNRFIESRDRLFDPAIGINASDGWAKTRRYHRADSLIIRSVDPDSTELTYSYDAAQRLTSTVDSQQNTTAYTYDARSNITAVGRIEKSSDPEGVADAYRTEMVYDPIDRLIESREVWRSSPGPEGNVSKYAYDSRGNLAAHIDPRMSKTLFVYDGLSRPVRTDHFLNSSGSSRITTSQQWDASSRVVARTDGTGHITRYAYDALDRPIVTRFADGTVSQVGTGAVWSDPLSPPDLTAFTTGFDPRGNVANATDARGTVTITTFDLLDRPTSRTITPSSGVGGDTAESFDYDGRSLAVALNDLDTGVERRYDSVARLIEERQMIVGVAGLAPTAAITSYWYENDGDLSRIDYPGGRVVTRHHDALDRLTQIGSAPQPEGSIGGFVAGYKHIGGRVRERSTRFTRTTITYNGQIDRHNAQNDFGVGHVASIVHHQVVPAPNVPGGLVYVANDAHAFFWDRAQNRVQHRNTTVGPAGEPHQFTYDALNRLMSSSRTLLDTSTSSTAYTLDGSHNLTGVEEEVDGVEGQGVQVGEFARSADAPELDASVHQYTLSPLEHLNYDLSGNLTSIRPRAPPRPAHAIEFLVNSLPSDVREQFVESIDRGEKNGDDAPTLLRRMLNARGTPIGGRNADLTWDWRNRLVEYVDHSTGQRHEYRYDALGRRVLKTVDADAPQPESRTTRFVYGGTASAAHWQVLEEQSPVGSTGWQTAATYIYGNGIDEAVHVWKAPGMPGGGGTGADYYLHHDDLSSTTSATDAYGVVVERYRYGDYGAVTILDASSTPRTPQQSVFGNTRLFTGREFDHETGLYHFRNRYLDPSLARFISRDPIGVWGDEANLGNPLAYVGCRPWTVADPMGLQSTGDPQLDKELNEMGGQRGIDNREPNTDFFTEGEKGAIREATDAQIAEWTKTGVELLSDSGELAIQLALTLGPVDEATLGYLAAKHGLKIVKGAGGAVCKILRRGKEISLDELKKLHTDESGAIDITLGRGKGPRIINKDLAGRVHESGIPFDKNGFPDFSGVSKNSVEIKQTGNWRSDEIAANKAAGYNSTPTGYVWHHHQNTTTMQLVPKQIHSDTGHTGGAAVIRHSQ